VPCLQPEPLRATHPLTDVLLEPSRAESTPTRPLSILVAEDTDQLRMWCHLQLQKLGHRVVSASGGVEAARLLGTQAFDLFITDVIMPDRDGLELILELRKRHARVRILAMSGGGQYTRDADCLNLARRLGAHAVVKKPFNLAQLLEGVALALDAE
jgi:CheY-like chemotaxis protein